MRILNKDKRMVKKSETERRMMVRIELVDTIVDRGKEEKIAEREKNIR